jgi:hypothetical protein
MDKDLNNFAPMLGFGWDVRGDGKMSVRSSYRVAFDRVTSWIVNDSDQTTPGAAFDATELNSGDLPTAKRIAGFSNPLAPPSTFSTTAPIARSGRPLLFDRNFRTPYVQQWMLSLQRVLMQNTFVELMYVGNKGTRLYRNYNINQPEIFSNGFLDSVLVARRNLELAMAAGVNTGANFNPSVPGSQPVGIFATTAGGTIPASMNTDILQGQIGSLANAVDRASILSAAFLPDTLFRRYPQFELLGFGCTCSSSTYHALQTQVIHRGPALTVQASWTWSRAIDDFSGRGDGISVVRDVNNRKLDKGPSDFDATHVVRGSFVYQLPFGGWQINGLLDVATGNPLTIVSGRRTLAYTPFTDGLSTPFFAGDAGKLKLTRDAQGRPVLGTDAQRAQFSFPDPGSPGGTGRNAFRNPGYWNLNFSVYKNLWIRDRVKAQFRLEFFNLFNHPIMDNLDRTRRNLSSADFGRFVSQRNDPRILQTALRLDF